MIDIKRKGVFKEKLKRFLDAIFICSKIYTIGLRHEYDTINFCASKIAYFFLLRPPLRSPALILIDLIF